MQAGGGFLLYAVDVIKPILCTTCTVLVLPIVGPHPTKFVRMLYNQLFIFRPALNLIQHSYQKSYVLTGGLRGIFNFKIGKTLLKQVLLAISCLAKEWLIVLLNCNIK